MLSSVPEAITTLQGADNLVMQNHDGLTGLRSTMQSIVGEINASIEYFRALSANQQGHEMPSFKQDEIVQLLEELHGTCEQNLQMLEEAETHISGIHENFETIIVEAGSLTSGS